MHRFFKTLIPLCILSGSACINVPDVDPPDQGTPNQPVGNFSLSADPTQASVFQGGSKNIQVTLTRTGGFTDNVTVSLFNPPAGISAPSVTIASGTTSATLTISVSANAEPGPKTLTLRGTAGTLSQDVSVSLSVAGQGDLLVQWASPSQSSVHVKDSVQFQVVVEGGTAESVDLYKDTVFLTRLSAPSYQYTWDTSQETEGEYQLTARATRGGATFTSSARTIKVDHTAPKVKTQSPAPGATAVAVRDTIQVTFDEPLKASTVTDASVVLGTAGASNVAKTLSLSADGRTLTLTPSAPLTLPATVTINLGSSTAPLTDLAGNALTASTPWTFTVPAWLPMGGAISAVNGPTPAENVSMKVATDGNPVIAWSESDGTAKNIYVRRWTGTSWTDLGPALNAVPGASFDTIEPDLVLDTANRPTVVWNEVSTNKGDRELYGSRWTGTTWASLPPFLPAIRADQGSRNPGGIAFDKAGNLVVTPFLASYGTYDLEVFRLASNDWETLTAPEDGSFPVNSDLAIDATGNWFMAYPAHWETGTDTHWAIYASKRDIYGNWSKLGDPLISPSKGSSNSPSLALNGNGLPIIAWEESSSPNSTVYAALWNGQSWQMLGSTINGNTTSNTHPSVVVDHDGLPIVAWSGYAAPETSIWVSRWNGSSWQQLGSRLSAATGASTAGFRPTLSLDKNGQPIVAWHESDGSVSNIYVYRYNY
ncbi:Ig-like domain-containing protein [Archangium lipolyticum]|uniref:Ig-like domain-containing protein n=1 Tax=Archangium lipolyticum TaxID=2970465 RepID=UPI00214A254D|nr:Ig-like domain-containing protein [Archangium lipolyticum]